MERFKKFSAVFALAAGICIPALWIYFLASGLTGGLLKEGSAAFLLVSEFITAFLLLLSGIGIIAKQAWAMKLWYLSMGMLLYALIIATGQFMGMNHPVFGPLFIILLAASGCVALLSILVKD